MLKPASLRAAIETALPELRQNPDRLLVFMEEGNIRSTGTAARAFEYAYTLRIVVTDYARHADTLLLPVANWLAVNQPEIFANKDNHRDGFTFEAELLDHEKLDLQIRLKLTERVTVAANDDGSHTLTHHPEPALDPYEYIEKWHLYLRHPHGEIEEILPSSSNG